MESTTPKSDEERKNILKSQIALMVARWGRVELQDDFQAVVSLGKRPNHILHLLLSLVTFGFWIFVWLFLTFTMGMTRYIFTVNEVGVVEKSRP